MIIGSCVHTNLPLIHESLLAAWASFAFGTVNATPPTATVTALVKNLS